jgi:hypothetical protein
MTPSVPAQNRSWFAVFLNIGAPLFTLIGAMGYFLLLRYPYRIDYIQEAHFNRISVLTLASLSGGILCGIMSLSFYRRRSSSFVKVVSSGCIFLATAGLVVSFSTPRLAVKSVLTAQNICINNIRQIEAAKADWAQKHGATNGTKVTWNDLASYFTNGLPKCPEQGNYELGKVGEPVTCSNPKHRIQDQQH